MGVKWWLVEIRNPESKLKIEKMKIARLEIGRSKIGRVKLGRVKIRWWEVVLSWNESVPYRGLCMASRGTPYHSSLTKKRNHNICMQVGVSRVGRGSQGLSVCL